MKNYWICFLTSLFGLFVGNAQQPGADQLEPVLRSITPNGIKSHMGFLADDLLEGRRPGTRGYRLAASYVESELISSGILPAGEKGFRQAVPMVHATTEAASCEFILSGKTESKLRYDEDYIISPDFLRSSNTLSAAVVYAGFGVVAPEFGYDDYKNLDVKGKVVLLLSGAPASFDSNPRAYFSSASVKYETAITKGAVGVITFSPAELSRASWEATARRASGGSFRWANEEGIGNGSYEELGVLASISADVAKLFFTDAKKTYEQVVQAAIDSKPMPLHLKKTVTLASKTNYKSLESDNVIGKLEGSDPELKKEHIVYVAHIDHFGIGKPIEGDSIYNGAHDNASGVSILLEIADAFTKFKDPPKRSIVFLFVTGEEYGLQGSDYFIQHPTVPKASIIANISMDMPFLFHPLKDVVPYGAAHSSLANEVNKAAKYMNLGVGDDPIPQQVLFIRSDHFSFVKKGIPALFNKSGFETGSDLDGKEVNLNWRSTRYHTPQDDMTQDFDFEAGADHARFNLLVGYYIAQNRDRPQWNKGDFFGERFGKMVEK